MTLARQAVGSIIRFGLAWVSGYLVRAGVWETAEATAYVEAASAAIAFALISLAWSLWHKYVVARETHAL